MRNMMIVLVATAAALSLGTHARAAQDECSIGDAALCLANKNCHWDYQKRGCYPGPGEPKDACAAHEDQEICKTDTAIGCKWSADGKCVSKGN